MTNSPAHLYVTSTDVYAGDHLGGSILDALVQYVDVHFKQLLGVNVTSDHALSVVFVAEASQHRVIDLDPP